MGRPWARGGPNCPPHSPQRHGVPAAAHLVTENKNTQAQPLAMGGASVSLSGRRVRQEREVRLGEGGCRFPWGGLCLKFNTLSLSLPTRQRRQLRAAVSCSPRDLSVCRGGWPIGLALPLFPARPVLAIPYPPAPSPNPICDAVSEIPLCHLRFPRHLSLCSLGR